MGNFAKLITFILGCALATYVCAQSEAAGSLASVKQTAGIKIAQNMYTNSTTMDDAAIRNAQMKYDIPLLLDLAKKCERVLIRKPSAFGDASHCNELALNASDALGNAHEFATEELWRRKYVMSDLKSIQSASPHIEGALLRIPTSNLKSIASTAPGVTLTWQADSESIPVDHAAAFSRTDSIIPIQINGHSVAATIVTRMPAPYPIIVVAPRYGIEAHEEELGLVPLISLDRAAETSGARSANKEDPTMLRPEIAQNVVVGPLVLHDLLIGVVKNNRIPVGVYLETPLLRRFGEVILRKGSVTLSRRSMGSCNSGAEMDFVNGKDLDGSLVFPVSIDGREYKAAFWSGDPTALQIAHKVYSVLPSPSAKTAGSHVHQGPVPVSVGSHTYHADDATVVDGSGGSFDVLLGNPILQSVNVHLIFDRSSPMICLSEPSS